MMVCVGWSDLATKDRVMASLRELAMGLRADGLGIVVDTYVAPVEGTLMPSANPAAREAIGAIGLLANGDQVMGEFLYGRDDRGQIHRDPAGSEALTDLKRGNDPTSLRFDGPLTATFQGVLAVHLAATPVDAKRVKTAATALVEAGGILLQQPHIDIGS